jgi:hypothetical protein
MIETKGRDTGFEADHEKPTTAKSVAGTIQP